jgi:1-acyl-sn-glycerol-3-phosphate acyltransferase
MAQPPTSPVENRPIIRILQAATVCYARIYHRVNVLERSHLPKRGPAILVSNHISGLDPVLIQSVSSRLIVWMMAKEYFDLPGLAWLFRAVQVIPVDRSRHDLTAMRLALTALRAGLVVGIFPEGRLEVSRELLPFQTGVALMGLKTGVPIFPCYLDGTQRSLPMLQAYLQPQHATICFGARIALNGSGERSNVESATKLIQSSVATLQQRILGRRLGKNSK